MNIAVFASGNGTNLQALIDAAERGELAGARLVLVVSDNPGAFALERARKARIKTFVLEGGKFKSREEFDKIVIEELRKEKIELVVLAGFMRILSGRFISEYENRILNIHPALLPSFKGARGIKDAFDYGVKVTGVTVHFVNNELDAGPIILQDCVEIDKEDTLDSLEEKIHKAEHKLYPEAVRLFSRGRLRVEGRKVIIKKE
ncbi:MAG: phosphoribosylglycinamide formyltransferase [Candidatus Omnitrophota bacterium]|jgi:phosphoribosylglycinamide formyltransferase-1